MMSEEFFLQKAIGSALREYAWTDPEGVIRYVTKYRGALSNPSKREALPNVLRARQIDAIP
jgi:3-methyladenine DNA glycosylase AlkD